MSETLQTYIIAAQVKLGVIVIGWMSEKSTFQIILTCKYLKIKQIVERMSMYEKL